MLLLILITSIFYTVKANNYRPAGVTPPGNAFAFDGDQDFFTITNKAKFNFTNAITIETWVRMDGGGDWSQIVSKYTDTDTWCLRRSGSSNRLCFDAAGAEATSTTSLTIGKWYHIAGVFDGSKITLYINGIAEATASANSALASNTYNIYVGGTTWNNRCWNGAVDELRIWNSALSQSTIQANMFNVVSSSSVGLVAYYQFDQGVPNVSNTTENTLLDATTTPANGVLTGSNIALTGATSNWADSYAMVVPIANVASTITGSSFTANWTAPSIGTVANYLLDVSLSPSFSSFVTGYNGLSVSGVSKIVSGLNLGTTYYYRIRAEKTSVTGQGGYSTAISVITSSTSSNADLSALTISSGTLSPVFGSGTIAYTASVSSATTSITLTPTKVDANATIKVNGTIVSSGTASGAIGLNVGSNTLTTIVTAQDGATSKTYTVTVTRAGSANADLSALAISSGTLSPTFAAGTITYTASVNNATTSITVTPTRAEANATIKVNGVAVVSGSASGSINLNVGSNTLTTIVTAQDGTTTKTYTVTVTRVAAIVNNVITANQTICAGTTPAGLTGSTPTGGDGSYVYSWLSSTTSSSAGFTTASGTTNAKDYTPSALTQNTWFRRDVTSAGVTDNSAVIAITVNPISAISPITGGNASLSVTVQAIGGGGGADGDWGASGGGGGAAIRSLTLAAADKVDITVGLGGISGIGWSGIRGGNGGDSKAIFNSINIVAGGGKGPASGMAGGIATGGTINLTGGAGNSGGVKAPGFDGAKQDGYSAAGGGAGNYYDGDAPSYIYPGGKGGGLAGNGGHGSPQYPTSSNGEPGFNYGGGGGGGGNYNGYGGAGGQGVVVITYSGSPLATGGTITQIGGVTTHTFSNPGSDSFTVLNANSATIGIGSTLQLADATAGGTWSSLNTGIATISASGLVTGIAVGTTTVTYSVTNSNGCPNSQTMSITVVDLPTISTLAAASSVCLSATSQTTTLNYSGVTGSPISYSMTWNGTPTNSFASVTDQSLASSPITITVPANTNAGTYTGTITVKNASGIVSTGKTFTITVSALNTAGVASATPTLFVNTVLTNITHATTGATGIGTATGLPAGVTATFSSNTITISGTPTAVGVFNYSIPLTGGCSMVNATGRITVNAAASSNADLSALAISSGILSPTFASGTISYTASVNNATTSITVTPTRAEANATIKVNGVAVVSGSASGSINLNVGSNTLTTVVTAQDGTTSKTYTVTVTRAAAVVNNVITANQTICAGTTPAGLTGSTPTGGDGSYVYSWLSSTTSSSAGFTTASGTTNAKDYTPSALTQNTWFRRDVTSAGVTDNSAVITITVNPIPVISPITGGNASLILTVQAIGGGGSGSGDAGSGGGGGGTSVKTLSMGAGQSATITVGAAGIPSGNNSANGGSSSVVFSGTTITAGGGFGASGGGGAGGISTGGSINLTGGAGSSFAGGSSVNGNPGATSGSFGSAGGGGGMKDAGEGNFTVGGTSGGGIAGAGGNGAPQYPLASLGMPGLNYGGGGGGGGNYSGMGGSGGQGVVVITYSGAPLATGGTITQTGGVTTHTFSNPGSDSFTVLNANSATIGIGSTLQLADATAGGTWSSLNTGIATISASGLVTGIAVGTTTVTYSVTNSNGCPNSQTMSITVSAAVSSNADLSALAISLGTLSPTFAAGTIAYTASVSNATTSITVTPTRAEANATIKVNGVAVVSGSASGAINLNVGLNTLTTVVTAQDGTTTKTYTTTVTRQSAPLPVSLINFTAKVEGERSKIEWATSSENNNNRFEVEVSNDGLNFRKIGTLAGSGTSNQQNKYFLYDQHPSNGVNYYRLIQYDNDGKSQELGVKVVTFKIEVNWSASVFPNPVTNEVNLVINNYNGKQIQVLMADMNGQVVHQEKINMVTGKNSYRLNLNKEMAAGQYIITIYGDGLKEAVKVLKL